MTALDVFIIHIAKYHPTPNVIQKCLMQVVQTFSKNWLMQRAHDKEHFTSSSCLNKETSRENVPPRFGQSQWPLGASSRGLPFAPGASRNAKAPPGERTRAGAAGHCEPGQLLARHGAGQDGPGTRWGRRQQQRQGRGQTGAGPGWGRTSSGRVRRADAGPCRPLPARERPEPSAPERLRGLREAQMLPLRVSLASVRWISRRAKPASRCTGSDRAAASTGRWGYVNRFGVFSGFVSLFRAAGLFCAIATVFLAYQVHFWHLQLVLFGGI